MDSKPKDRTDSLGRWLVGIGIALPVVATVIALVVCPFEPCGGGGPGTCLFGHNSCRFNPGYVWLYSSLAALVLIPVGRALRRAASRATHAIRASRLSEGDRAR
jgi:hypothetical protein